MLQVLRTPQHSDAMSLVRSRLKPSKPEMAARNEKEKARKAAAPPTTLTTTIVVGPRRATTLPKNALLRDVTHETKLIEAAR